MKELLGGVLVAAGVMIASASGLCTFAFVTDNLTLKGWNGPPFLDAILIALTFFGTPFLIGVGLVFAGRALIRSARKTAETERE